MGDGLLRADGAILNFAAPGEETVEGAAEERVHDVTRFRFFDDADNIAHHADGVKTPHKLCACVQLRDIEIFCERGKFRQCLFLVRAAQCAY